MRVMRIILAVFVLTIGFFGPGCNQHEKVFSIERTLGEHERLSMIKAGKALPSEVVLRIRAAIPSDFEQLFALGNSEPTNHPFLPKDSQKLNELLTSSEQLTDGPFNKLLVIELRNQARYDLVGALELYLSTASKTSDYKGFDVELSIIIARAYRRFGYATVLIKTVVAYAQRYFEQSTALRAYVYEDRPWSSNTTDDPPKNFDFKHRDKLLTFVSRVRNWPERHAEKGGWINEPSLKLHSRISFFEAWQSTAFAWFLVPPARYLRIKPELEAITREIVRNDLTIAQVNGSCGRDPHAIEKILVTPALAVSCVS